MKLADVITEYNPLDDLWQAVLTVEPAPFALCRHHQPEGNGEPGPAAEAALGSSGPVADGGEGAFDRVRRADVLPVFGREVMRQVSSASRSFDSLATAASYLTP